MSVCWLQVQQPWSQDHCQALTDALDRAALLCAEPAADLPQVVISPLLFTSTCKQGWPGLKHGCLHTCTTRHHKLQGCDLQAEIKP